MTLISAAAPAPTLPEMTRVFLRIGLLSFGGPAGQIALMHRELVDQRRWLDDDAFLHGLNFCMLLPGPEAMQLATYIGWRLHGLKGGLIAGTLFVLPGFLVMLGLSIAYAGLSGQTWFASLFFGLKAAVLAVVVEALLRVAKKALKTRASYGIAALSFVALFGFAVPFPLVVLAAGIAGYIGVRARPDWLGARSSAPAEAAPVLRHDHVPGVLGLWGALWALPVIGFGLWLGWGQLYPQLALFFSKMAVVTFGGAYAVLAYVAQAAVENFGWLKLGQMIDGLALAETTPGPLILVLSYVGFLAAWQAPGPFSPLVGGIIGAVLTTWVTCIPCFLWIFLGAPYIEYLRRHAGLTGALSAIGAAVVGVILNLTVWFALQTLFLRVETVTAGSLRLSIPDPSTLDGKALLLAVLAMVALFRLHIGMLPTLAFSALAGFALKSVL